MCNSFIYLFAQQTLFISFTTYNKQQHLSGYLLANVVLSFPHITMIQSFSMASLHPKVPIWARHAEKITPACITAVVLLQIHIMAKIILIQKRHVKYPLESRIYGSLANMKKKAFNETLQLMVYLSRLKK